MFVKKLRGIVPSNVILIWLFSILLWLKLFFAETHPIQLFSFPYFVSLFPNGFAPTTFSQILIFFIVLIESIYVVRLNVKYMFIDQRTYFHSFVFILWITTVIGGHYFYTSIIANLFLLIAFDNILKLNQGTLNVKILFNTGLFVGIASVFYPPSVILIFVFWVFSLLIYGLNWRGLFAQILGFISVWMVIWLVFLASQSDMSIWDNFNFLPLHNCNILKSFDLGRVFYLDIIILPFFVLYYFGNSIVKKIIVRKYFNGFFWTLILFLIVQSMLPFLGIEILVLIAIPVTFFISNAILNTRSNIFSEFMFLIILAIAVYNVLLY